MNRRDFLRRSAGAVAADQLEILEKLGGWARKFFSGWRATAPTWNASLVVGHASPLSIESIMEARRIIREAPYVYYDPISGISVVIEREKLRVTGNRRIYPA